MPYHHEVITVQIGPYSNLVGSHWWNMQEASFCFEPNIKLPLNINHDVLFREGKNYCKEVTFLPRLLCIDDKDNFQRPMEDYSKTLDLDKLKRDILWDGAVDVLRIDSSGDISATAQSKDISTTNTEKNMEEMDMQSLNKIEHLEENSTWYSQLNFELQPRSLCHTERSDHIVDGGYTFCGQSILSTIEDNIRSFAEECDYLQGFQILMDGNSDFVSVSNSLLYHLSDEYSKSSNMCFPCFDTTRVASDVGKEKEKAIRSLNSTLMGFNCLVELSSMFNPMSLSCDITSFSGPYVKFPYLDFNPSFQCHTSAILAATLDALTSPYRLKENPILMPDLIETMTIYGRKLIASSVVFPFMLSEKAYLPSMLREVSTNLAPTSLTPFYEPGQSSSLSQFATFRGFPSIHFEKPSIGPQNEDVDTICGRYLGMYSPSSIAMIKVIEEKCSFSERYPNMFSKDVVRNQYSPTSIGYEDTNRLSLVSTLNSTDSVSVLLDNILSEAKQLIFGNSLLPTVHLTAADDFKEVINSLTSIKEDYETI